MKKVIKIVFSALAVILVGAAIFLYIQTRASGDMDDYKAYYHDDTGKYADGGVKITFLGTSTLLIDDGETQLLTDGFLSRLSLVQTLTSKLSTDEKVIDNILTRFQMDRVKGIFVTHSHYDHAFDAAYVTKRTNAKLYGSESTLNIGRGDGLKEEQMSLFEPGKELQLGSFGVTVLKSKHSPMASSHDDTGKVIDKPLSQPAKLKEYVEGGSFDFLIKHKGHLIFIKPNLNYIEGSLDNLRADVLFLGVGTLSQQSDDFKTKYYDETIGKLKPKLVLPLHWDNFLLPLSEELKMMPNFADDTSASFQYIIQKTKADNIGFKILQGGKSIILFADDDTETK
jgi:L-ascorbate metabolism protein UlaG (beta-lactamase superfamily)